MGRMRIIDLILDIDSQIPWIWLVTRLAALANYGSFIDPVFKLR